MYVALQINSQQLQGFLFYFLFAITAVHNFFVILSTDARVETRSGTSNVGFGVCHNMSCLFNVIACCCLSMLTCFFAKEIWKVSTFMVS